MFAFIYIKKPVAANAVNLYHQIKDMLDETFWCTSLDVNPRIEWRGHLQELPVLNGNYQ